VGHQLGQEITETGGGTKLPKQPKHPKDKKTGNWLGKFSEAIKNFLMALAEARIPPSKIRLVPKQGSINLATGLLGIVLFTAAGQVNALTRDLTLSSQLLMATIGAALLFLAAVVVIFASRRPSTIVDDWNRTASVFVIVWLLSLVVFAMLALLPLLLTQNYILLDKMAYWLVDRMFNDAPAWVYNLAKSLICTFLAGLILIFRTKRADRHFSLKSVEPWVWLALMTVLVGFVFDISLYQISAG
jgi:hypothetical protein